MRVVHVIKKRDPSCPANGMWTFAENVHAHLRAIGVDSVIVTSKNQLAEALSNRPDIVHIHGIWHLFYHEAFRKAKSRNLKVVYSTHGMTSPWALKNGWWKKLPVWALYQKRDLYSADAIHSMSNLEESWNTSLFPKGKRLFTVPLGTDERKGDFTKSESNVILFVGRISKVKAIDDFLHAIERHCRECPFSDFSFRIIGPDERNCLRFLKKICSSMNLDKRVEFCGYMDKSRLSSEYEKALALVLPSKSENFGSVVIEALSHGTVVVASKNTPWEVLSQRKCGWHVDGDVASLKNALDDIWQAKNSGAIDDMQANAVKLVDEFFRWPGIVEEVYRNYLQIVKTEQIANEK